MFVSTRFDPVQWLPRPGEGIFEYWASLSPMAPMFGVNWRFGDIQLHPPLTVEAPMPSPIRADAQDAEIVETPVLDEIAAAAEAAAEPEPEIEPEPAAEAAPVAEPAPVHDTLTEIKGIGPKMAARLAEAGVTSYAQIAAWGDADIARMEESLGGMPGAIVRQDWVGQAKALAG